MHNVMIVATHAGDEVYCKGLLETMAKKQGAEEVPYVLFVVIADTDLTGKYVSIQDQLAKINKSAQAYGFAHSIAFSGREYFGKLHLLQSGKLTEKIKREIQLAKPKLLVIPPLEHQDTDVTLTSNACLAAVGNEFSLSEIETILIYDMPDNVYDTDYNVVSSDLLSVWLTKNIGIPD